MITNQVSSVRQSVAQMRSNPPQIEFYMARDRRRLAARVWRSVESPIARVVFLHGITSHSAWYEQAARHQLGTGCDVHFLDRRGFGLHAHEPGGVDDWHTWSDDVAAYLRNIR